MKYIEDKNKMSNNKEKIINCLSKNGFCWKLQETLKHNQEWTQNREFKKVRRESICSRREKASNFCIIQDIKEGKQNNGKK